MDQNLLEIKGAWSPEEDEMLQNLLKKHGLRNWSLISKFIPGRSSRSCRSRWLSLDSLYTPEEDEMLQNLVEEHGPNWSLISTFIPGKSDQSCRSRWLSHQVEHRPFTPEEDETILRAHELLGNDWANIGAFLISGHTDDEIEDHWKSTLKWRSSSMTYEDINFGSPSIYIPPPSISDMLRDNMSSGGTHAYSRDGSAPSWNALNERDSSPMMNESDNVQKFAGDELTGTIYICKDGDNSQLIF